MGKSALATQTQRPEFRYRRNSQAWPHMSISTVLSGELRQEDCWACWPPAYAKTRKSLGSVRDPVTRSRE